MILTYLGSDTRIEPSSNKGSRPFLHASRKTFSEHEKEISPYPPENRRYHGVLCCYTESRAELLDTKVSGPNRTPQDGGDNMTQHGKHIYIFPGRNHVLHIKYGSARPRVSNGKHNGHIPSL